MILRMFCKMRATGGGGGARNDGSRGDLEQDPAGPKAASGTG